MATPSTLEPNSPSSPIKPQSDNYTPLNCYTNQHTTLRVPADVVSELVKSLQLTEPRWAPAIGQLSIAFTLFIFNVYLLVKLPWFLLPAAWSLAGVTLSNLFVISHDCAHNTFTSSKLVNRIIGELTMLPLAQPFAAYKQRHLKKLNLIHKQKNNKSMNKDDTQVVNHINDETSGDEQDNDTSSINKKSGEYDPGLAEIPPRMHAAVQWFRDTYRPHVSQKTKKSVAQSQTLVFIFLSILLPSLLYIGGITAILKYFAMPLFAYKLMYRAYWNVITNNFNAYIPNDINYHVASYNAIKLSRSLQTQFSDVNTSIVELIKSYAKRINWINTAILFGTPIISLYGIYTTPLTAKTFLWSFIYYFWTGLGITAGYHRLWAHRSYDASFPVKLFLLLGGSGALEGSLKWWAGGHRVHHRYTDTPKDPYNSKGGFWYAHLGWMLVHPDPKNRGYADIRDLNADPLIRAQHKYYLLFGPIMAFVFPALVAYVGWNDFWGGLFYAGYTRLVFVHHNTFCVNSVAHYFGEQTFDDERTPRDNVINAFFTFGEGFHNFHHEFPNDYRNGLKWYDYDPTKWLISAFALCGLTYNLREFDDNAIRMGVIHMNEKRTQQLKSIVHLPPELHTLPEISYSEFQSRCTNDHDQLIIIDNVVHDIGGFIDDHPGGAAFIKSSVGSDGSAKFNGSTGIYRHSNAARNVLAQFRIARLVDAPVQESIAETEIKESQELQTKSAQRIHDDIHTDNKMSTRVAPDADVNQIEKSLKSQ